MKISISFFQQHWETDYCLVITDGGTMFYENCIHSKKSQYYEKNIGG